MAGKEVVELRIALGEELTAAVNGPLSAKDNCERQSCRAATDDRDGVMFRGGHAIRWETSVRIVGLFAGFFRLSLAAAGPLALPGPRTFAAQVLRV